MIRVSLVSPKGTEKQSSCLLAYLKKKKKDYRQNVDDKTHHFYSRAQSVVTTETILSSVSSGKVKLSDPISKVVCKPFKQVSWTPLRVTHLQHRPIHVCVSSFSCSQVRVSDSLGLLFQILETDRFALVVQEHQQSNTKFSITPIEWWCPFVVEEKETSIPFDSVCLFFLHSR